MRISDWSSDVCSSDLRKVRAVELPAIAIAPTEYGSRKTAVNRRGKAFGPIENKGRHRRLETQRVPHHGQLAGDSFVTGTARCCTPDDVCNPQTRGDRAAGVAVKTEHVHITRRRRHLPQTPTSLPSPCPEQAPRRP